MKIVAASDQKDSAKCLSILADIMKTSDNYLIIGPTQEWFEKTFSLDEMLKIYNAMTGDEIKRAQRSVVIYQMVRLAENVAIDERTSGQLIAALGRPFTVSRLPAPEKSGRKGKSEGGYTRPREGTATGQVWDVCDTQLKANAGLTPAKETVVEACVALGINPSTAATQYGKWKSSQ